MNETGSIPTKIRDNFEPDPTEAITRNPAFAFVLEAQIEGLEEVFERLGRAHPASFREICKGQDLLENLHILLAGGPTR